VSVPTQVGTRALFAFLALGCFVVLSERRPGQLRLRLRTSMVPTAGVAICLATASATFVVALSRTTVAHVLLFQALSPLVAAGVGVRFLNESLSRGFWLAMALSIVGVVVMVGGPGGGNVTGDGCALLSSCAFAGAVLLARRHQTVSMAPAACLAQLLLVLAMAPFADPTTIPAGNLVWLFLLGAGQLGVGLASFTAAAQLVPAARLSIIVLLEVVLGPIWVWIGVGERPTSATLVGGALVLAGVVVQVIVGP
jgi:drug/metabolite transporter (DMT)-like permease